MHYDHVLRDTVRSSPGNSAPVLLRGRLLTGARVTWLVITILSAGLFLAGVPFHFRELGSTCVGSECTYLQLSSTEHLALQNLGFSLNAYATFAIILSMALMLVYVAVASIIFRRRPKERMALLVGLWMVTFGTTATYPALEAARPALAPLLSILDELGWVFLLPVFLFTFPNGRFVTSWTRWLLVAFMVVAVLGTALEAYFPELADWPGQQVLWFSTMLTGIATQVYRYRRVSDAVQRQQTKWVVFGLVVAALGIAILAAALSQMNEPGLPTLLGRLLEMTVVNSVFSIVALTIGYSVLRYRLWDIDIIINRALIWGLLSGLTISIYALIVGALGTLFQSRGTFLVSMLAAGSIAVLFHPLRQRVQRGVNRLMYGDRDEPYFVLSQLGQRLQATLAPEAVLPTIVETVAQTLKLPYVAVRLNEGDNHRVTVSTGEPVANPLVVPLTYQGDVIGQLICGPRSSSEPFNREEQRLLADIAYQAGMALEAVQSNADLQRSRERLVTAREEERRRIRRDLHDGLGPALASQTLKIGSARALLNRDPQAADALLQQLETDSKAALKDVRRLVYNLRPPALDEIGLLRAIQQDAPSHQGLDITFDLPSQLPELSAAVEVAVYRIVQEALANVVHHAQGSHALVRLDTGAALCLTVEDNGQGLPAGYRSGVGLNSMRERAEELGGTFRINSTPGAGTTVEVRLPLRGQG